MSRVTLLHNDGTIDVAYLEALTYTPIISGFVIPSSMTKLSHLLEIFDACQSGRVVVMADGAMKNSAQKAALLSQIEWVDEFAASAMVFFTSGTSGNPIGIFKSREHLERECSMHIEWLSGFEFEQCVVSVPFFHIYGFLFGMAIPLQMGLEIVTKEDFLPSEIVKLCSTKKSLCITNPVFIRAMLRLRESIDLGHCLFISSSGPLESVEALAFEEKYSTRLIQLYGSSETGGIAIRKGGELYWTPLEGVKISSDEEGRLCVASPYLSTHLYDQTIQQIDSPFQTSDIIHLDDGRFKIIGRASELVKIGGKRLSMVEIEQFLENLEGIEEALGFVEYHPGMLRGETMTLYLVGDEAKISKTALKKSLHDQFGGIHIESKVVMVDSIAKTALGKKIRQRVGI